MVDVNNSSSGFNFSEKKKKKSVQGWGHTKHETSVKTLKTIHKKIVANKQQNNRLGLDLHS